ncbi:hypothetical protein C2845_PM16G02330 [Panicum miliaceum]|uniref:Fumarylacetoacetase n=1 Tax=Panicum miliaceum TaxID=4540 RepID=A0A3L6PVI4_PANMI|nr:hypothetical protein C2845_PM16G02330 [Panicum miliaceum]
MGGGLPARCTHPADHAPAHPHETSDPANSARPHRSSLPHPHCATLPSADPHCAALPMLSPPPPRVPASAGWRFSFSAGAFAGVDDVAGKSSLARVRGGSAAAGDAHAKLGSKRDGDGSAEMEACIGLGWRRIGYGIAHMDARIGLPRSSSTLSDIEMVLPITVGGYTDFFCSVPDGRNCGFIFRGLQTPVNPNWFHLPVGYNGRASSVSRTDAFDPDAAIVGPENELGKPIDINNAEDHISCLALMNDWSARDIQAWETIPLGSFLKSFSTTISPWIVTLDALKPFTCEAPKRNLSLCLTWLKRIT